jgi:hypothetical protein
MNCSLGVYFFYDSNIVKLVKRNVKEYPSAPDIIKTTPNAVYLLFGTLGLRRTTSFGTCRSSFGTFPLRFGLACTFLFRHRRLLLFLDGLLFFFLNQAFHFLFFLRWFLCSCVVL